MAKRIAPTLGEYLRAAQEAGCTVRRDSPKPKFTEIWKPDGSDYVIVQPMDDGDIMPTGQKDHLDRRLGIRTNVPRP